MMPWVLHGLPLSFQHACKGSVNLIEILELVNFEFNNNEFNLTSLVPLVSDAESTQSRTIRFDFLNVLCTNHVSILHQL